MKTDPLQIVRRMRRSVWTLPLAALAALVLFGINEAAYDRSTTSLTNLGERAQARTRIQLVWRSLIDAETGQRGFLLTGRQDYLAPYQRSVDDAEAALAWLERYYAGDAETAPVLAEVREYGAGKLSELSTTLQLHTQGRHEAWRELVLTDIGRERMEGLRTASQRLLAIETRRVDDERANVFATVRGGRIGINAMTLLSLLALFLFLRQTLAFDRAQRQHAAELQLEHDRLEQEVGRRTADLTELARHLQTAREDEKSRLARELHDELGALLTAAKLDSARLKRMIGVLTPEVEARLKHLNDSINRGIELKRRIIEDLRPSSLSNLGLVAALEILTREFALRSEIPVQADLDNVELSDAAQITVFRLVQEALTNAAKYARAKTITVTLKEQEHAGELGASVSVEDDGCGFDPDVRQGSTHGLMGMRYRVEAEGGQMRVQSAPGQGSCVGAWLPLRSEPDVPEPPPGTGGADAGWSAATDSALMG